MSREIERRNYSTALKRAEGDADNYTIAGEASIFGVSYDMGWYDEIIEVGAADLAIQDSDVRCLFNHDPNMILGRTSANTLTVTTDGTKLTYSCIAPDTSYARDLGVSIARGDIAESSFGFTIRKQRWEEHRKEDGSWRDVRYIMEFEKIYDVSPVTYPANPDTSVAKRSHSDWQKVTKTDNPTGQEEDDIDTEIYKYRLQKI